MLNIKCFKYISDYICDVIVSMLELNAVDSGFDPQFH